MRSTRLQSLLLLLSLPVATTGCVSTAVAVVKAPFQIVGAGVDAVTTSQAEADRNRGRRERKAEEAEAKAAKKAEKQRRREARESRLY